MSEPKSRKTPKTDKVVKEQQGYYEPDERFEIIGGIRYDFLSSPKYAHQKILTNFHLAFHESCGKQGEIWLAPMDVHFDEENIVQPDVIYIAPENLGIIRDGFIYGVPDLVVEILSDSTGRRDKTVKKAMYERFGVKEYLLADPMYRTVDQFVLDGHVYSLRHTFVEGETFSSPVFACLSFELDDIFPPVEKM